RGRERSRSPENVCREVGKALKKGAVEVTLLGQNITAYRFGSVHLEGILDKVSELEGLERLRFVTSHPRYLTHGVIEVMSNKENICNHIHLPVQSGSDRILKLMGRRYTTREYLEKIRSLRESIPDISITSDIIVGFPGERREDFEETISLMNEVVFDDAFTYRYSPRPKTPALRLRDQVKPLEAQERLSEIISIQRHHTAEKNRSFVGRVVEVLVERESRRSGYEFFGKTTCARSVVFGGKECQPGELVNVGITGTTGPTLLGRVVRT
ncbi:MAG: MiaB/RimO family radical SAM methylthiotransferase, partial [Candidatus Glassbacteria bacterium]